MLVVFIITIITALVLSSNSKFNSAILLRSFAYEVGLAIREAQLYGIATKVVGTSFNAPYGVHISLPASGGASSFFVFADINSNYQYEAGDSVADTFNASHGFFISQICLTPSGGGTQNCYTTNHSVDIVFRRPDPSAIITGSPGGDCPNEKNKCPDVEITVSSPAGSTRKVEVASTGLITVTGTGS